MHLQNVLHVNTAVTKLYSSAAMAFNIRSSAKAYTIITKTKSSFPTLSPRRTPHKHNVSPNVRFQNRRHKNTPTPCVVESSAPSPILPRPLPLHKKDPGTNNPTLTLSPDSRSQLTGTPPQMPLCDTLINKARRGSDFRETSGHLKCLSSSSNTTKTLLKSLAFAWD